MVFYFQLFALYWQSLCFFTKLLMLGILYSTSCILLSLLSKIVLNNIIKFYKIFWNCFKFAYTTFQIFLASTFSKYSCIITSWSLDLWFSCIIATSSLTFTSVIENVNLPLSHFTNYLFFINPTIVGIIISFPLNTKLITFLFSKFFRL